MAAGEAESGAGDIPITLDGEDFTLKPTLEACLTISKLAGGLSAAVQRCSVLHFETIVEIIALGIGATSGPQKKLVQEKVFRTGLIDVSAECIRFIRVVANGGRPPADEGDDGGQEAGPLAQAADESLSESITTAS